MKTRTFQVASLCLALVMGLPALSQAADSDIKVASRQERLEAEVVRNRKQRTAGGDYDDQLDRITLTIKVKNLESKKEFEGLKATIWMLGESQQHRGMYKILTRESFDFKLGVGKQAGTFEKETKEVVSAWDDTDVVHGYRYQGWILAIQDKEGTVIFCKSTRPNWEKDILKAYTMETDKVVDRKFELVDNPPT